MAEYVNYEDIASMMESFETPPDDCKRRNQETEFVDLRGEKRDVPPFISAPPPPPPPPPPSLPSSVAPGKRGIQTKYRLPMLNLATLKLQQVKGTVFSGMDDVNQNIEFNNLEEIFKLDIRPIVKRETRKKRTESISLMEPNRLKKAEIIWKKLIFDDDEVCQAISCIDLKKLTVETADILLNILPNEDELKAYKQYEEERLPLEELLPVDRFMLKFSKIERLSQKLQTMSFIGSFEENLFRLDPQVSAIKATSESLRSSNKVKKIFGIILAIGNYMNSAKSGAVYGFKLQSLDVLTDTKSKDKNVTLMHFLVQTVQAKFPEIVNFDSELQFLKKAAEVSVENILTAYKELEKGMQMTQNEYKARKNSRDSTPPILKEFLTNSEDKLKKLQADIKTAEDAYKQVAKFFAENPNACSSTDFFTYFVKFVSAFKGAVLDKEKKILHHVKEKEQEQVKNKKKDFIKEAVEPELMTMYCQIKEKKLLGKDKVEDILLEGRVRAEDQEPPDQGEEAAGQGRGVPLHSGGHPTGFENQPY